MFKSFLALAALLAAGSAMPQPGRSFTYQARQTNIAYEPANISAITSVSQSSFQSYQTGGLIRGTPTEETGDITKRYACATSATLTWGDTDTGGIGVTIENADTDWRGFYIYYNSCDYIPYKYIWIAAGATEFVSLPSDFQGRIVRGVDAYNLDGEPQLLATWLEITMTDGIMYTDISLIRGCDGASLIWSLDGSGAWKGFTQWILDGAPTGAYDEKNDGQWVLAATEGADAVVNTIPRDWEIAEVGADYVYVVSFKP